MGGKAKQSQRTKNNVRPSSSSRSAELLNNSVNLDSGLVSVGPRKGLPTIFPSLAALTVDQGLPNEFQICIKKLNKKDPITRTKALQELCELVNNSNVDDVVAVLPSWAHFYKTLTTDTDRKVREMTQLCHSAMMRVCGRRVAPQLKLLVPAWLQAQYDEHPPAYTHAHNSLKNTFPDAKLPEVISFCRVEVMAHFLENLIGNTEAIITKKIEQVEDREMVLCRIVTSSLRGLEYFIPALPAQHHEWLWTELGTLLDSGRYWKYATHNSVQLRAAWYGALGRAAERFREQFAERHGARALRAALAGAAGAAGARGAAAGGAPLAAHIWTALLQFMHNIHDWYKYLDKPELLVKRIVEILESGGWGDARHLSNIILPLLAHLPLDMQTKEFYENFFSAIYKGLNKKNIISSKSERQAWITSLAECLRYLSIQEHCFVVEVATSVHRMWLENIFCPQHDSITRNNLVKCSSTNMSSLVKYWLKQSQEGNGEKYDQLLRNFWQNTGATVLSHIDKCSADLEEIDRLIEGHILLLLTLKSSFSQGTKKQQSIKFDGDEPSVPENNTVTAQQWDSSILDRYRHNLNDLAHKICANYFEMAEKKQVSNAVLTPLIAVLDEFDSKELFVALAGQFGVDSPYKFYERVLKSWLSGDTMRCKVIVDITFQLMKYLSEEEQDAVFDSFKQLSPCAVEWCLSVAVSPPHAGAPPARRWARGGQAGAALLALARRATAHPDAPAAALLFSCLTNSEPLFSEATVSRVLGVVSEAVASVASVATGGELERGARLGARLVTLLASAALVALDAPPFGTLVLRLFRLNLLVPRGDGRLAADTWREVRGAWRGGALALRGEARARLRGGAARLLRAHLLQHLTDLNVQKIEDMVSLCPHLFHRSIGEDTEVYNKEVVGEIVKFTEQIFKIEDNESISVETCALRHDIITSQLNCLYDDDNEAVKNVITNSDDIDHKDISKLEVTLYINKLMFRAMYLKTLLLHNFATEDEETNEQNTWCDSLLAHHYIEDQFCDILYKYSVLYSLNEGYTFWAHYDVIRAGEDKLRALLAEPARAAGGGRRRALQGALRARAAARGRYWARAHRALRAAGREHEREHEHELGALEDLLSGDGYFHMLQASIKDSSDEELAYKVAYLVMLRSWNVAHSRLITADFIRDMAECRATLNLDVIINAYYRDQQTMLYDVDVSEADWSHAVSNAAVAEFLALAVRRRGWDAPAHHWDFTTITLCSLLDSLCKARHRWTTAKVALLWRAVARLFGAVAAFVGAVRARAQRERPAPHVAALPREWADVLAPPATRALHRLLLHVLDADTSAGVTCGAAHAAAALVDALPHLAGGAGGELAAGALARSAAACLRRAPHPAQLRLAHGLLLNVAHELVYEDSQKLSMWSEENSGEGDEEKEPPQFLFDYFHETFTHLQDLVETALNNVVLGEETCELVSMSDSHLMALSWLLLADALGAMCKLARGDLEQFYIRIYRERGYAQRVLGAALRLLPPDVFAFAADSSGAAAPPARHAQDFLRLEPFSMSQACSGAAAGALACLALGGAVAGAGCGAARGWWGAAPPRVARLLERLVAAYVAPRAVRDQLADLHARAHEIEDTEIRIAWSSSEVTCLLSVEDSTVELQCWLARAHPLVPPRLRAADSAGPGGNTQWLALYLAYQNGTLLNALKMWTQAVNARVERSPQCYICYCRLHAATGRLPRVPCHQCRSRFHNQCIRKWFATSNKSNCPLCRGTF